MCKAILTDDEVETALADYLKKINGGSNRVSIREVIWREVAPTVRVLQVDFTYPDAIDVAFTEVFKQVAAA
jgi:hypothetical protein